MAPSLLGARHPDVARLRQLLRHRAERRRSAAFVLEGPKLLAEALDAGAPLEAVFVPDGAERLPVVARADAAGVPVRVLARGLLERVADATTPQAVIAVCHTVDLPINAVRGMSVVVVCVDVQDPGNAGTILRSAEASGAGAVLFTGASVDPYNPKAVRASAGSLFHVPMVSGGDAVDVLAQLGSFGLRRVGTHLDVGEPLDTADLSEPLALVLGNEAHGLPDELDAALDARVVIPMTGRSESLNVGMAAAVLCFEVARRRRGGEG